MTSRVAAEVLYETETTLRLVDHMLDELQVIGIDLGKPEEDDDDFDSVDDGDEPGVANLTPLRINREVQDGLRAITHSRQILERTSDEKTRSFQAALPDRPDSTPADALGGLDRALSLIGQLLADLPAGPAHGALGAVREELRVASACLRLCDVTEQQLSYASSVLLDMEDRFSQLGRMLDPTGLEALGSIGASHHSPAALRLGQQQALR